jgi:hypothetical protein
MKKMAALLLCRVCHRGYLLELENKPDMIESIFNEAEKCELLNCVGYAHGYHKGTPTKESLVKVGTELVKKAKAKDNAAIEELYKGYYADVLYICRKYSLNDADSADVAQETFKQI